MHLKQRDYVIYMLYSNSNITSNVKQIFESLVEHEKKNQTLQNSQSDIQSFFTTLTQTLSYFKIETKWTVNFL